MLTFVIPAYKESPYLEEVILSLKSQTIACEILMSTSTPNDFIKNLANKYDIKLFFNPNPKYNMVDDMNFALSCAKNKYCTLAHQDDLYEKEFAEKLLIEAEKYHDNLISFSFYSEKNNDRIITDSKLIKVKKFILKLAFRNNTAIKSKFLKKSILSFGSTIPCPAVMFNRQNINNFKFSDEFKLIYDWEAWYYLAKQAGSFVFVNESLMFHRLHNESATMVGINNYQRILEDKKMFSKIWIFPFDKIFSYLYRLSYTDNIKLLN